MNSLSLYETIKYKVVYKEEPCEIRSYGDILLASTKTRTNTSLDSGFSNVFSYISGNNKPKTKISMTTPVVSYEEQDNLITGFYIPSKFNKDSAPEPDGDRVFIQELKESLYAVIKFRGYWTTKNYDKHDDILLEFIKRNHYEICSPRFIFRYQPPFIPGIFRHNEIAYQIQKSTT